MDVMSHRRPASLGLLALLAACDGAGDRAEIQSISPARVDLVTDQPFATVHLYVVISGPPGTQVCPVSPGADFPVAYALYSSSDGWDVLFEPDPGLTLGDHVGELEVFLSSDPACQQRDGPSRRIPYHLSKIDGFAQPQGVSFRVTAATTAEDLRGSARIDMTGGPAHGWTARTRSSWIVVDTAAGVTGGSVGFHVNPAGPEGILDGSVHSGWIDITGDTAGMTSRSVDVDLQAALPIARAAMPADQPAGPARRFRVRGVGFTAEAMASGLLEVAGAPGAVLTRLTDRDLVVELPAALPAGTYRVVTPNALGLPLGSAQVQVTAPLGATRSVLPGKGAAGHLLWDGARGALFVLEPLRPSPLAYSYTLRRHTWRDGTWSFSDQWVDMWRRMGLSPGGEKLVATSDSYWADSARIYVTDPDTLRTVMYGTLSGMIPEPPSPAPLAVTVDGRAWTGAQNNLISYDLFAGYQIRTVSLTDFGWAGYDYRPPSTMASRDGGRLLVSRAGAGPFVYLDLADRFAGAAFHVNAAGATSFDGISDDGGRVLSGTNVYDGDFILLGTLPGPATLSGDGRRAFTLESRSDWQAGGPAPVVHVFDLTAPAGGGALPELGAVDLLDHVTCTAGEGICAPTSSMTATPDGRVLFVQTEGGVVVVPIPEGLAGP